MSFKNTLLLLLLITFCLAVFPMTSLLLGKNSLKRNNLPAEKQYPAVELKKREVDIDRDFNKDNEDMEKKWEEFDTDRPGEDYRNFRTLEGVKACRAACVKDPDCKAYT